MDYLNNYGFDNLEIEEFSSNVPDTLLNALHNSYRLVEANIKFLISLGIKNYKDIFKNYYDMFLIDNSNFANIFNQYDQQDLVSKLEQNIEIIEFL